MSDKPKRIQLSRKRGWRMPAGAVKVDRSTKWGNPFKVGEPWKGMVVSKDAADAVGWYDVWLSVSADGRAIAEKARVELRGKSLACWCSTEPGTPCHGDVFLRIANQ